MRLFFGLAFLVLVGIAMFAIQNSTAPSVDLKFVVWNFRTSLVYTILGTFASGMVVVFLLWIPSALRASFQKRSLRKEIEILEKERRHDAETSRQGGRGSENEA
jgi:uncharacterized integral membrane protein